MCSFSTATSLCRYSIRDCCSRLTQLARMISINCHGCKTNFIGISAVRQIQDNHWRGPKCKAAQPVLCAIEACRRSVEHDRGNIVDAIAHVSSTKTDRCASAKSQIFTLFVARLSFLTPRGSGTVAALPALNTIVSAVVVSSIHVCVPAAMPSRFKT
jgi:hypothetical protein